MNKKRAATGRLAKTEPGVGQSTSLPALLENGSDDKFRDLIQDLLGFTARIQAIRGEFGKLSGLTGPQYSILIAIAHLSRHSPDLTVTRLAEQLHVSGTFITAETNKLLRLGYIQKTQNLSDRRSVFLDLTTSGRRILNDLLPIIREVNDEIFRGLPRNEFMALQRRMSQFVASADAALLRARSYRARRAKV